MHSDGYRVAVLASHTSTVHETDNIISIYRDISEKTQQQLENLFKDFLSGKFGFEDHNKTACSLMLMRR